MLHRKFSAVLVVKILPNFMGVQRLPPGLQNQFAGYCYNPVGEISPNVVTNDTSRPRRETVESAVGMTSEC